MKKTIKPIDLQVKTTTMDASGKYNWEKQVYEYDSCKFGTYASTYNGTSSSSSNTGLYYSDDSNSDSISD